MCLRLLGQYLCRMGFLQVYPETDLATLVMLKNTSLLSLRFLGMTMTSQTSRGCTEAPGRTTWQP